MEKFHEDVYRFIYALITNPEVKKKVKTVMNELGSRFFDCLAATKYHQCYEGGLADHTALVVLEAYHMAVTKKWLKLDTDNVIIAALFHDIDKIGNPYYGNASHGPMVASDDIGVVKYIDRFGLVNGQVQDGIILAHGGWSKAKGVDHPAISIVVHAGDMLASHATRIEVTASKKSDVDVTRDKITLVMKRILKILDAQIAKESIKAVVR